MEHHWHAYSWTGRERPPDSERRDPNNPAPPLEIAHWLRKPARQVVDTFTDVDAAYTWAAEQVKEHPPVHTDLDPMVRLERARDFLTRPSDVVWGYYTSANAYVSRVLILCPRAGERCPAPLTQQL